MKQPAHSMPQTNWLANYLTIGIPNYFRYVVLFLLLSLTSIPVFAQADDNPFELKQRIPDMPVQKDTVKEEGPINPFDIDRTGRIPRNEHVITDTDILRESWKVDGFTFWVFLGLLSLLAILMPFGRNTISAFYRALTGAGPFNILFRNYGSMRFPVGFGLYVFFLLNIGLFIFLVGKQFDWLLQANERDWLLITLGISTFVVVKLLIINFLGWTFPIEKDTVKYRFLIGVFNSLFGLILFPVNWLLAYGPEEIRLPVIYVVVIIAVIFYIYRYMIGISSASQQILRNRFNFFMYLCTLEIAPLLVIVKYVLFYK